jgi:small basic protein
MSRFNERFFARLDAAAEYTGMPALARQDVRRRHLRWLPIVALVLATGGWVWGMVRPEMVHAAYGVMSAGFVIAAFLPIFGPIKPWGGPKLVDEFDRQVRLKAFLYGYASVTFTAYLGIWLLLGLALAEHWAVIDLVNQFRNFAHLLFILYLAVPTLQASWATRPVEED